MINENIENELNEKLSELYEYVSKNRNNKDAENDLVIIESLLNLDKMEALYVHLGEKIKELKTLKEAMKEVVRSHNND